MYLTKVFNKEFSKEFNGCLDHWFLNMKDFLCSIWNLCKEKLYSLSSSSSYLVSQSSIK